MPENKQRTKDIKDKPFAQEVREFFGMPEPGQKKLTPEELERQAELPKVPTKAGEPKKRKKSK